MSLSLQDLRIGDAKAALAVAAAIAECTDERRLASEVEAISGLIGAEAAIVTSGSDWLGEVTMEVGDPSVYSADLLGMVGRGWRDHPLLLDDCVAASSGVRRLSDFVVAREWRRSGLFNDFYRPLGLPHELSTQLAWEPGGSSCCVALHRSGRDFDARELTLLALLAPHLRAARARIAAQSRAAAIDGAPSAPALARRLPITPREAEVLALLADGHTNGGIAHHLGISRHTVVRHVEHIYAKLDVHTRAAATRVALGRSPADRATDDPPAS